MITWKNNSKIQRLKQSIKDFNLFIKQCYFIVWSEERKQNIKKQTVAKTKKKRRSMLLTKFAVCDSENVRFIKEQESSGLLKSLGIKILFIKILLVGPLLF